MIFILRFAIIVGINVLKWIHLIININDGKMQEDTKIEFDGCEKKYCVLELDRIIMKIILLEHYW